MRMFVSWLRLKFLVCCGWYLPPLPSEAKFYFVCSNHCTSENT